MKISVFSSGSSGNCELIRTKNLNILIDAGITKKQIDENLLEYDLTLNDIDVLLITHEHSDHVKSLVSLLKYANIKTFMSRGTYYALLKENENKQASFNLLKNRFDDGMIVLLNRLDNFDYEEINYLDLKIKPIAAFHDAAECVGYVLEADEKRLGLLTDTGYVHQKVIPYLLNLDCYILESNHDPEMLMSSSRPYYLKQRILSDHGHLSNQDSMATLVKIMGDKTKLVMHAHISNECNLSEIVELTRKTVFNEYGISTEGIKFVVLHDYKSEDYEI
ncbi:MAG: MBL fold metallo-hydrolase [Acholeplasmatales bacterium]|nr:MBL fold metallo-hydrolase [Acholeplasmatales bacterium]MBR6288360.1 MBL fold metallo-hydrolase [Acholeplasmatales bacterium]